MSRGPVCMPKKCRHSPAAWCGEDKRRRLCSQAIRESHHTLLRGGPRPRGRGPGDAVWPSAEGRRAPLALEKARKPCARVWMEGLSRESFGVVSGGTGGSGAVYDQGVGECECECSSEVILGDVMLGCSFLLPSALGRDCRTLVFVITAAKTGRHGAVPYASRPVFRSTSPHLHFAHPTPTATVSSSPLSAFSARLRALHPQRCVPATRAYPPLLTRRRRQWQSESVIACVGRTSLTTNNHRSHASGPNMARPTALPKP